MSNEIKNHVLSIIDDLNNGTQEWRDSWEISETPEPFTGYDYLEGVLDINWILNSDRTLKGARLLVAFGGPNIWIDTSKGTVEGAWWGDSYSDSYNTDSEFARELDDALETVFSC